MGLETEIVKAYFDVWDAHDTKAILSTFTTPKGCWGTIKGSLEIYREKLGL